MSTTSENNKRIAKNTLFLYVRMLLIMGVTLYTSRVVLQVLGVEDFGIYNVVGGVVVLFSFINNSLAVATQRFLNFELGRGDLEMLRRVFSMSLTIHICVTITVILLAETIGLWFLNTQLDIPSGRMEAANWVYQFSILSVCVSFVRVPYYASVVSYEKMSFFAYIAFIEGALKLLIVFLLIYIGLDKLKLYAVLSFGVSLLVFMCYKYYCNRNIETCDYKLFWDKVLFVKLVNFSGWMLLGAAAGIGFTQGVNILLNIFCGVAVNAAMGICNQVNAAVNQFVSNFQTAFMPRITQLYAMGDMVQLRKLIDRSSRFSFLLLFALAVPLMLNIDFVLNLWLKNIPEYTSAFCILILAYSLIESVSKPVGFAIHATGRVKFYNISMSLALSMNIVFSYFFLRGGFSPEVVLLLAIWVNIICFVIRLVLTQRYKVLKIGEYLRNVVLRVMAVSLIVLPLPFYFSQFYMRWTRLFLTYLIFLPIYVITAYYVGLTQIERAKVRTLVLKKIPFLNNIE